MDEYERVDDTLQIFIYLIAREGTPFGTIQQVISDLNNRRWHDLMTPELVEWSRRMAKELRARMKEYES